MKFKFNGQSVIIAIIQTPFFFLGYLLGLVIDALKYGYFVGSNYWDD